MGCASIAVHPGFRATAIEQEVQSVMEKSVVPVLVVGAGPTGLTMASELRRQGVDCRVIDKTETRSQFSKALGVHARTMEVFFHIGIIDKVLSSGWSIYGTNLYYGGKRLVHLDFGELESPYPFVLMIPQSETERVLDEHLNSHGGKVERVTELVTFQQSSSEVIAKVKRAGDDREEEIRCQWLVACDGSHSTVRHTLNVSFEGAAYEELFATADVQVGWSLPEDEMHAFFSPDGALVFFPFGNHRYRIIATVDPARAKGDAPTLEEMQTLINERGPQGAKISDPRWLTWFKIHRRSINQYRHGRVFLAGDAAHIHSPIGGVGMNTGIQDAYNLAWKLALVVKGKADQRLLDSYQDERHPVGQAVLKGTDMATKVATLRHPVAQQIRNHVLSFLSSQEVIQQRLLRNGSLIGVNYRHSPIVGELRGRLGEIHVFGDADSERPNLANWIDFGRGPSAGDRAPDAIVINPKTQEPLKFFQLFKESTSHHLCLFDGRPTPEGYDNFVSIHDSIKQRYGDLVEAHLIVAAGEIPNQLKGCQSVWLDPDLAAHHVYGAGSECLYVIRPDGYVGFRAQPAQTQALEDYFGKVLSRNPVKV